MAEKTNDAGNTLCNEAMLGDNLLEEVSGGEFLKEHPVGIAFCRKCGYVEQTDSPSLACPNCGEPRW